MCLSSPSMPAVPEVSKPQEAKQASQGTQNAFGSTSAARKNTGAPAAASTFLTGPSGIENKQLALQRSTLLGG